MQEPAQKKRCICGVSLGFASETIQQLEQLKNLFVKGELKATIDKSFTIDNIADAHRYVETGRKKGNVLLEISK
jgi:NADPH:quinone reductase-like Zn-dependent oxidoreductase